MLELFDIQGGPLHVVGDVHNSPGGVDNAPLPVEIFAIKAVEHFDNHWVLEFQKILLLEFMVVDGRIEVFNVK